jgi:hypothetical protein
MDALLGLQEEESAELQPEFAASLRRSLEQARLGEGIDLQNLPRTTAHDSADTHTRLLEK